MSGETPFYGNCEVRCTRHAHPEPVPCAACCYTDNGFCRCGCHEGVSGA
jgi:hypothetical protein